MQTRHTSANPPRKNGETPRAQIPKATTGHSDTHSPAMGLLSKIPADNALLTNSLSRTKSLPELIGKTQYFVRQMGIDGFFHFELEFPASILDAAGIMPERFLAGIKANAFQNYDLVLRHLLANPGHIPAPLFRSAVDNHVRSAPYEPPAFLRHKEFSDFLHSLKIFDIFYLPIARPDARCPAVFCCWSTREPIHLQRQVNAHFESILRLASAFDQFGRQRFPGKFHPRKNWPIPPSVRSIVELYAAKDVPFALVARIRGVHDVTVNKQMMVAKRAFGTSTSTGVVLEMIRQGLISVDGIL